MVHRLNFELGKYQRDDETSLTDLPDDVQIPNFKNLAPLIVAYDEELAEKDEIIADYERQLFNIKLQSKEVVAENEQLLTKIEKFSDFARVDPDKHLFLKENAEIVLAENDGLKDKIRNIRTQHSIAEEELNYKVRTLRDQLLQGRNQIDDLKQDYHSMYHECQKLRENNSSLSQKNQNSIQIKDHEDKLKQLTLNNKQLSERLELETSEHKKHRKIMETELDEIQQKYGKKELQLNQAEVENKVYKKMVRKYENLVSALRQTVSTLHGECEKLQIEIVNQNNNFQKSRQKPQRSSSLQDVRQKEMKILARINKKLSDLKSKADENPAAIEDHYSDD